MALKTEEVMQKAMVFAQSQLSNYKRNSIKQSETAFADLKNSMQKDHSYAWSWHCNIAMSAFDEGVDHSTANKIAARFMKLCFDVDTSQFKEYTSL